MNLFFLSPSAVGNLINETKTMYAMRSKRFSCLIHFSLCYDFYFFFQETEELSIATKPYLAGECILSQPQEPAIAHEDGY